MCKYLAAMDLRRVPAVAAGLLALLACRPSAPPASAPAPIPVPRVTGPLRLGVVYPPAGAAIDARDSSFLLGSTGTGDATLSINGQPVPVAPNGAWLAWLPLPADTLMRFTLVARAGGDSAVLVHAVRRARRPPPAEGLWVDSASFAPRGRAWVPRDEPVRLLVRATAGASARLRLADGGTIPLVPDPDVDDVPPGIRAFDRDSANLRARPVAGRYVGVVQGRALGPSPGRPFGDSAAAAAADTGWATLELVRAGDTLRTRWPLQLALLDTLPVVRLDDDPLARGGTDSLTVGRAVPGGTYHWFFPTGTRAVADRRQNGDVRLRLGRDAAAWVVASDARPEPAGTPAPLGRAGSITLAARADAVVLRLPLGARVPFRVDDDAAALRLRLYSTVADADWTRYPAADSLVTRVDWAQARADEVEVVVRLARPLWGWRTRWDGTDLLLEIRRPPVVDPRHPLRGRRILVDAGHPPLGATGPTGLREAAANLGVALEVRRLLEAEGATVLMTRTDSTPVELWPRVQQADTSGAELLVSVHNNALPDGVNPFTNNGTTVFYNHAPSAPLARAVQRALVARLGLRDLGIARGDLALVRPTWLPSILCEGLFMIVPEQEAALRSPDGRRRYAEGVVAGLREWLAAAAGRPAL